MRETIRGIEIVICDSSGIKLYDATKQDRQVITMK